MTEPIATTDEPDDVVPDLQTTVYISWQGLDEHGHYRFSVVETGPGGALSTGHYVTQTGQLYRGWERPSEAPDADRVRRTLRPPAAPLRRLWHHTVTEVEAYRFVCGAFDAVDQVGRDEEEQPALFEGDTYGANRLIALNRIARARRDALSEAGQRLVAAGAVDAARLLRVGLDRSGGYKTPERYPFR